MRWGTIGLADSPVLLGAAPVGRVVRSFQATLTITSGRMWLCDYTQLTMAAQYDDEAAMESDTPWITVANGRYLVTVKEVSPLLRGKRWVCISLEPLGAGSGSVDSVDTLVPWFKDVTGLDMA
jgi:hypothetical protein